MNAPIAIVSPSELERAAKAAVAAADRFNSYPNDDAEWDRLLAVRDDAARAFRSARHRAGISQTMMRSLLDSGVVS